MNREHFSTELPNPQSERLDELAPGEAFDMMNAEDARVAMAVRAAKPEIVAALELVTRALQQGGRLIYCGAGTSGRLGVLDAVECPPTFQSDPAQVQAIIAGGPNAFVKAEEGAEDSRAAGAREVDVRELGPRDVLFGIAAGGTTPFVHGAIARARERGARTVFFSCVPREQASDEADVSIRVLSGPEVLAGSTRLKAGTATKLVLNMISTLAMARIGKVHGNRMVDVNTRGNAKLWQRGIGLIAGIVPCDRERAEHWLKAADGQVKLGIVMARTGLSREAAQARLDAAGGFLRRALDR